MSFSSPSPAPLVMPAAPAPVAPLAPATIKPGRKPMLPTFLNAALAPGQVRGGTTQSLIGGAPTQMGA